MDKLYDLSETVVIVSAIFIIVCTFLVVLRTWVRAHYSVGGPEDYLCVIGLILWLTSTSFMFPAARNGLGAYKEHFTAEQAREVHKYFFFFETFYVWSNIPVKLSICFSIHRLSVSHPWITRLLYVVMFAITSSSIAINTYVYTTCTPVQAMWDNTIEGSCRPAYNTFVSSNIYSAINIATDWIVALSPVFILWKLNMPLRQKLIIMGILSLGIFASTATLIRLGTLSSFTAEDNYIYGLGPVCIWTVVELGLALVAVSLMALRPLFRRLFSRSHHTTEQTPTVNNTSDRENRIFRAHGWSFRGGIDSFLESIVTDMSQLTSRGESQMERQVSQDHQGSRPNGFGRGAT